MSVDAKYILGTEGKPDYLVIEEVENLKLGVKGFSGPGPGGTIMLAMRIRAQHSDLKLQDDTKIWSKCWDIPWIKVSDSRASFEVIQLVNQSHFQFSKVVELADTDFFGKAAIDYLENLGLKIECGYKELIAHLYKAWFEETLAMMNPEDPKLLLTKFVEFEAFKKDCKSGVLTVTQKSILVKGNETPWPKPTEVKKSAKKKSIKGQKTKGDADNVVTLNVKKKKTPKKK